MPRKLTFEDTAWEDYLHWQQYDKQILKRLNILLKEIQRTPESGIGKPEALKHEYSGAWSRRITEEHRLVYIFTKVI
jgi:toxin YoeB